MQNAPQNDLAFAHAVRYRDAMLHAWLKTTGRVDKKGASSYDPADLPAYLTGGYLPTNEDRSRAEVILFKANPLPHGQTYFAYLAGNETDGWYVSTFTGEMLARITKLTRRVVSNSWMTNCRGSFWAVGVDGRLYRGHHNGLGMYLHMRLAKQR